MSNKNKKLLLCAVFAAISAALSPMSIPIGAVPVNLVHISVLVSAGLLGAKYGGLSQLVFVLLGVAGLPIFSGFSGGLGAVLGPTGGFIISYISCAIIVGWLAKFAQKSWLGMFGCMYLGWAVTYILGISWFMAVTGSHLLPALQVCLLPFIIPDLAKTIAAVFIVKRLRPVINR